MRFIFIFVITLLILTACSSNLPVQNVTATSQVAVTFTPTIASFKFGPQTADEAQELLTQAEKTVLDIGHYGEYRSQIYIVAEYAAWDAWHRFPNDPRVENWKWEFAYYAALSGDSESANNVYIDFIVKALNENQITVADLPLWFQSGGIEKEGLTPPFLLEVNDFSGQQKDEKFLIRLGPEYSEVSCYLLSKSSDQYSMFIIYDGFSTGYNLISRNSVGCDSKDLTNDGIEDVVITNYYNSHANAARKIQVFDISTQPPKPLPFSNFIYDNKYAAWNTEREYPIAGGKNRITAINNFYRCSARIIQIFEWDSTEFKSINVSIEIDRENASLKECWYQFFSETESLSVENRIWVLDEAIKFYEALAADDQERQILDQLRIQKGLIHLFANQPDKTRAIFQEILKNPYQKNGIWQIPIQNFLNKYQNPTDIYRACAVLTACNAYTVVDTTSPCGVGVNLCASDALSDIFKNEISSASFDAIIKDLEFWGVEITGKNRVDLDLDGKDEIWFTIARPENQYNDHPISNVYVVSEYPNGVKVFPIEGVPNPPLDFEIKKIDENKFYVKYWERGNFIWSRDSLTNEPSLWNLPYLIEDYSSVERIIQENTVRQPWKLREKILMGNDIPKIYKEYKSAKKSYDEACPNMYDITMLEYNCGTYYFDLAFAAELAGDEKTAREMYATVVEQYPDHPLALLAKNKLGN